MKEETKSKLEIVGLLALLVGLPAALLASGDILGLAACVLGASIGIGSVLFANKKK